MNTISNKAVVIGDGKECPKCKRLMERRKHPSHWRNNKSYYYTEWDFCKFCKHVQHYEEFKSSDWQEQERQESFFNSLR